MQGPVARYLGLQFGASEALSIWLAASVTSLVTIVSCISFASLIFAQRLSEFATTATAIAVFTAFVIGIAITLGSSSRRIIALPDDETAPLLALLAAGSIAALPLGTPPETLFLTALCTIVFCTLVTGIGLYLIGRLKLGGMVRYLPYSVMSGYFAGTGWLLVTGSLRVVTELDLDSPSSISRLVEPDVMLRWAPCVLTACCLTGAKKYLFPTIATPCALLFSITAIFGVGYLYGFTPGDLMRDGWLLGPMPEDIGNGFNPVLITSLGTVNWSAILGEGSMIATIMLLSVISLLLAISSLSLKLGNDLDINRELRVAGRANIASALCGGWIGLPSTSATELALSVGAPPTRLVGLIAATGCLAILFFGMQLIAWLPKPVIAGLLMFLGASFFKQWVWDAARIFPRLEYLVILSILLTIALFGFLPGVMFGLIADTILFVVNYSRTNVIRYEIDGSKQQSNVERGNEDKALLKKRADEIRILKLHGYLFFGTMSGLERQLKHRANQRDVPLRFAVIDFSQVTGIDSSATMSLQKMAQGAIEGDYFLIITGLSTELKERIRRGGFSEGLTSYIVMEPDLDRGIEWCEEQLLADAAAEHDSQRGVLAQIQEVLPEPDDIDIFKSHLTLKIVSEGEVLARQGEESATMFLIESSAASVYLDVGEGERHRIRRTGAGTIFGEIGFFLGAPRTATVIADAPGVIYVLDHVALSRLQADYPHVASAFHQFMIRVLADRLLNTTSTLSAVLS